MNMKKLYTTFDPNDGTREIIIAVANANGIMISIDHDRAKCFHYPSVAGLLDHSGAVHCVSNGMEKVDTLTFLHHLQPVFVPIEILLDSGEYRITISRDSILGGGSLLTFEQFDAINAAVKASREFTSTVDCCASHKWVNTGRNLKLWKLLFDTAKAAGYTTNSGISRDTPRTVFALNDSGYIDASGDDYWERAYPEHPEYHLKVEELMTFLQPTCKFTNISTRDRIITITPDNVIVGCQTISFETIDKIAEAVASARTFANS